MHAKPTLPLMDPPCLSATMLHRQDLGRDLEDSQFGAKKNAYFSKPIGSDLKMKYKHLVTLTSTLLNFIVATNLATAATPYTNLVQDCVLDLAKLPGPKNDKFLRSACEKVKQVDECVSVEGRPIYHYEKAARDDKGQRVIVFSLIHGDEVHAGSVGRYWMERLEDINPRNAWRVVPILNPDGLLKRTRTNANHIDLNRNFPTKDWEDEAIKIWREKLGSNPRRNPGPSAGSEPETKCALKHIEDFKPHIVVSIHTPLRVLDFDGPKIKPPKFDYLPWKSLGHYPGSLGRYMWFERSTPVLTTELGSSLPKSYGPFEQLQDLIGQLVIHELE